MKQIVRNASLLLTSNNSKMSVCSVGNIDFLQLRSGTVTESKATSLAPDWDPVVAKSVVYELVRNHVDFIPGGIETKAVLESNNNNSVRGSLQNIGDVGESESGKFPLVVVYLFDPRQLSPLAWERMRTAGSGLLNNAGLNICFMNAVLQALTYTPSVGEDMLAGRHSVSCEQRKQNLFCCLCKFESHVQKVFHNTSSGTAVRNDFYLVTKEAIWPSFRLGRQHDSHEFLRFFVDALHNACLPASIHPMTYSSMSNPSSVVGSVLPRKLISDSQAMTTYISLQFGAWLKGTVICSTCQFQSTKFDPCYEFPIDIFGVSTLENALKKFVEVEELNGNNQYECPVCKCRRNCRKKLGIYKPPRIITIPLKRFGYMRGSSFAKNCKAINFPLRLQLEDYLERDENNLNLNLLAKGEYVYSLFAVICHYGNSLHHGHYMTYAKAPNGFWFAFDDAIVTKVSESCVLSKTQEAYILFYSGLFDDSKNLRSKEYTNDSIPITSESQIPTMPAYGNGHSDEFDNTSTSVSSSIQIDSISTISTKNFQTLVPVSTGGAISHLDLSDKNRNKIFKLDANKWFSANSTSSIRRRNCISTKLYKIIKSHPYVYRRIIINPKFHPSLFGFRKFYLKFNSYTYQEGRKTPKFLSKFKCSNNLASVTSPSKTINNSFSDQDEASIKKSQCKICKFDSVERIKRAKSWKTQFIANIDKWSDIEDDYTQGSMNHDAFENVQKILQPPIVKRNRHDIQYDMGKLKKVKSKVEKSHIGPDSKCPSNASGTDKYFIVHQKTAFDEASKIIHVAKRKLRGRNRRRCITYAKRRQ